MSKGNHKIESTSRLCVLKAKDFNFLESYLHLEYLQVCESNIYVKEVESLKEFIARADKLKTLKLQDCSFSFKGNELIDQMIKDYTNLDIEISGEHSIDISAEPNL